MYFKQFYEPRLAQYSYMIGCSASGEALIVDPLRDIGPYLAEAEAQRLRITRVAETHIHADFLSGARGLAQATGAELLLSDEGGPDWLYAFPHTGLRDGDAFRVGNVEVRVWHTPGHTPEHLAFLITDPLAGDEPAMILSGDFVFVGDVGRPDLLDLAAGVGGTSEPMARRMFASLQRFRELPDHVLVWPGHGAGSACGKALGATPASTVGYEKRTNWALQEEDEDAFVVKLLADQPAVPRYFRYMKLWNRSGEKADGRMIPPPRLSIQKLDALRAELPEADIEDYSEERLRAILPETDVLIVSVYSLHQDTEIKITRDMIGLMEEGSVVVDVSINQTNVVETSHFTTLDQPTFIVDGIVHYCVPNLSAAVPLTASKVITKKLLPFVKTLMQNELKESLVYEPGLLSALTIYKGKVTHRSFAERFGYEFYNIFELLELNL